MSSVAEFHAVCNKQGYPQTFWGQVLLCQTFLLEGTGVPISKLALSKIRKVRKTDFKRILYSIGFNVLSYCYALSMPWLLYVWGTADACPAPLFETCRCALFERNSWIGKSAVQVQRLWIGLYPIITCWAAQLTEVTSFNLDNPIQILPVENILGFQAVLGT